MHLTMAKIIPDLNQVVGINLALFMTVLVASYIKAQGSSSGKHSLN